MYADPISSSLIVMIVSFLIVAAVLWSVKPAMVLKMTMNGPVVDWTKVVAYSVIVAVLLSIVTLIALSYGSPKPIGASPYRMSSPRFSTSYSSSGSPLALGRKMKRGSASRGLRRR